MKHTGVARGLTSVILSVLLVGLAASDSLCQQALPSDPEKATAQEEPVTTTLTPAHVEEKIKELEAAKEMDEELRKKLLDLYQQTLGYLQKAGDYKAAGERFRQDIERAPELARKLREKLQQIPPESEEEALDVPAGTTAKDLRDRLTKEEADLAVAMANRDKKEDQLRDEQTRPEKAREEQAKAKQTLEEIETALKGEAVDGANPLVTEASRAALQARKIMRLEEISKLQQELVSHSKRTELLTAERDLAVLEYSRLETRTKKLQAALNRRKDVELQKETEDADRTLREAVGKHEVISKLAREKKALTDELVKIVREEKAATPDKQLKESQRQQLDEVFTRTKVQLEKTGLSGVGGNVMRERRKTVPELLRDNQKVMAKWSGKIPAAESRRFQISMDRRDLIDLEQAVRREMDKEIEATLSQQQRDEIEADVRALLTDRRDLLKKLSENYESYLKTLRDLDSARRELGEIANKFAKLLDEWLLWIPSSSPPDRETLGGLRSTALWLFAPENWAGVGRALVADTRQEPVLAAVVLLAFLGLFLGRKRMNQQVHTIARKVGGVETDKFSLTLAALLWTLLVTAPLPLLVGFVGWRLQTAGNQSTSSLTAAVGAGLFAVAKLLVALRFFQVLCRPRGVAEVHFRWRAASLKLLRWHLAWLFGILPVAAFLVALTEAQTDEGMRNSLGRLAFMIGAVAQAVFIQRVVRPKGCITAHALKRYPEGWLARLRYVWYPLAVAVPLCLLGAAAIGYYYTAIELERRMIQTVWLVVGAVIVQHLALRWLVVEQRRLAVEQAREKREAEAKAAETARAADTPVEIPKEMQPVLEVPEVDISTINEQTRTLLRTLTGTAIVVGLWLIWSSVLPALAILEEVKLWATGQVVGEGGVTVTEWITLEHVALAIIALVLTAAAARNLPGLLEIVVLKNLPIEPGMRYAITTVSQYVLVAVGIVVAFNVIGVGWSKVQWLVAALSVGIGFGMQEIIANFFCGLILLFERPIRVGDIVTVGDTMGTVSKIRIRATTITNWDRMDLVIPNKELITGRLLNWTLSNTINRIVVSVGIAYGSDTDRARELLLKVADEHPLLMKDPAPIATFEGFGDSSLNLALRCYLPDFANRLATIHELHSAVNREFEKAGVVIPFPQRDLHLRSTSVPLWQVEKERHESPDSRHESVGTTDTDG